MRRPDPYRITPSGDERPSTDGTAAFSLDPHNDVTEVARALAAHGGGAVAFDLALDLVLNEVVEQARSATGATGAAIALARDGEMVCRATTGPDAPDLGVRVETKTGLSGACLKTAQVQSCLDTETDERVNAEVCRQLGVRSMVIVPLGDALGPYGILEVFSSQPHAFGERDVETLRGLAHKIAANKKEADAGPLLPVPTERVESAELAQPEEAPDARLRSEAEDMPFVEKDAVEPDSVEPDSVVRRNDIWTWVLGVLVIATAVTLGVVIGWRGSATGLKSEPQRSNPPVSNNRTAQRTQAQPTAPVPVNPPAESLKAAAAPPSKAASKAGDVPTGGLVVTQNGKVIYRVPPSVDSSESTNRLIRRVEPEYPAEARKQNIQGAVVLDVQVLGDGTVGSIETVTGNPLLADAAVHAVRQWKYQPYVVDGQPVQSQTRITIKFRLPAS